MSRINLLDTPTKFNKRLNAAKLTIRGMTFDDPERPECNNLLSLYMLLAGKTNKKWQVSARTWVGGIQAVADRDSDCGSQTNSREVSSGDG